jgi:hypothetical protein
MMRELRILGLLLAAGLAPLGAQRSVPSRDEIAAVERVIDQKLHQFSPDAPLDVLGLAHGVYLEGYGAVFTAEVNLLVTPGITPFRPQIPKEDVERVRETKVKRLPAVKVLMQEMLVSSASSLDRVQPEERVALGVTLFYNRWENSAGLPHQIVMDARKRELVDVAASRVPRGDLTRIIRVRED